jgi:hypothetical protein
MGGLKVTVLTLHGHCQDTHLPAPSGAKEEAEQRVQRGQRGGEWGQ